MDYKQLHKLFEGLATKEEEEAIRNWINHSPENKKRFLEERKIFDILILNVRDSKKTNTYKIPSKSKTTYWREWIKIAAVMLITLTGSWLYYSTKEKSDITAMQTIKVPAGQRLNLVLPDGTNVWLNARTTIQYPVSFNTKERTVTLDGQAYFEVAPDKEKPFTVKTADGTIQALGTKFDVMAYSNEQEFETVLMEGSVKVDLTVDSRESLILTPNNKAYLKNGQLKTSPVDDYSVYLWREGLICFKHETFEKIMESFQKTFDIKIVIQNTKISRLSYTGKFRIIDGVDYALRILQKDVRFNYEKNTTNHILYIK